jgi:amidase
MKNLPAQLWQWDAADVAWGIRASVISSGEAVASCLARIDQVNPVLNALVLVLREEALRQAEEADRAVRRGDALGPLHGVPVTTKLNADQAGVSNNSGVVAYKDRIATEDNPAIANLRKAGAIIVGRTNTPPFCLRWMTENELYGRTLNPWSREHVPGGSTGGGSAAVAAGMGPLTQGSDNGGSIRYPAFCTGIAGLRPTPGRIPYFSPSQPERPISMQLIAVAGPLARRVRDLRLGLQAMAVRDPRDNCWEARLQRGRSKSRSAVIRMVTESIRPLQRRWRAPRASLPMPVMWSKSRRCRACSRPANYGIRFAKGNCTNSSPQRWLSSATRR